MKRVLSIALLSLPLALAACGDRENSTPSTPPKSVSADDVQREAKQAVDTASDYAKQQRQEIIAKAEQDLADLNASLEDLKSRARNATAETKAQMEDALRDLDREQAQSRVQQKLAELKAAGADAWQEAKADFETAMEKLRESYAKAKQAFS